MGGLNHPKHVVADVVRRMRAGEGASRIGAELGVSKNTIIGIWARHKNKQTCSNASEMVSQIEYMRESAGLSKEGFSKKAGYSSDQWAQIIKGRNPSFQCICDFAQVVGLKIDVVGL